MAKFNILDHQDQLTPTKRRNRYYCPHCGCNDFTISPNPDKPAFKCWHGCTSKEIMDVLAPLKPGQKAPRVQPNKKNRLRPKLTVTRVSADYPCQICRQTHSQCYFTSQDLRCINADGESATPTGYVYFGQSESGQHRYVGLAAVSEPVDPMDLDAWKPDLGIQVVAQSKTVECSAQEKEEGVYGRESRNTASDRLIEIAQQAIYFHTPDKVAYADVWIEGNRHTYAVRSKPFKLWLSGEYFKRYKKGISSQTLQDSLNTLEAIASLSIRGKPMKFISGLLSIMAKFI